MGEPELVAVRFTKPCGIYNPGEVAGFSQAVAGAYVQAGAAEYHQASSAHAAAVAEERAEDPRSDPLAFAKDQDAPKGRRR